MPEPLTIPEGTGVDWGGLSSMLSIMDRLRERDDADKVQAIRYQGQQDYSQMVAGGADPMDAMLKAAPKLFHRNPAGMAQLVEAKVRQDQAKQKAAWMSVPDEIVTIGGEKFIQRNTQSGGRSISYLPTPRPPPTDPFLSAEIMAGRLRLAKAHDALLANPTDQKVIDEEFQAKNDFLALKKKNRKPVVDAGAEMPLPGDGGITAPSPPAATNRIRITGMRQTKP